MHLCFQVSSGFLSYFLRCCFLAVKTSPLAFLEILLPGVTVCVTYSLSDPEHTHSVSLIHGLQLQIELQPVLGQDLLWQYPFVVDTPMHTHSHTHKDKLCLHCFITHAYPALFLISWYQCFLCHAMLAVIHYLSRPLVCLRYISIPPFPSPPIFWIPFHPPIDRFPLLSCTGKSVKPELLMLHTTVYSHRHMWAHDSDPVRITTRSKAAGTGCSPFKRSRTGRAVHP